MMRRTLVAAAVASALMLAGCTGSSPQSEGGFVSGDGTISRVPVDSRQQAPVITGTTLDGKPWRSDAITGKVLVYNVWGSWCAPCVKEAPALAAAAARTPQAAQFVGLNTRDVGTAQAQAFVRDFGITYPNLFDPAGELLLTFGGQLPPNAIPTTLLVDRHGRIAARVVGEASEATLVALINEIAAER